MVANQPAEWFRPDFRLSGLQPRLLYLHEFLDSFFAGPQGPREFNLGKVVGIQGGDQIVIGNSYSSLRLNNFNGVGNSGSEPVPGLGQGLVSKIEVESLVREGGAGRVQR